MSINKSGYDLFNLGSFVSILMWMLILKCWMLHKVIVQRKIILNISGSEGYQCVKRVVANDTLVSMITLLAMTKVVVIALGLTTTHHPVVTRITTTEGMWSLYF